MRLIDADILLDTLVKRREYCIECAKHTDAYTPVYRGRAFENECIAQIVEDMAATPVDPVKHGHWIYATSDMSEKQIVDAIQDFVKGGMG